MLEPADLQRMVSLVRDEAPRDYLQAEAREVQKSLNPHPAGQMELLEYLKHLTAELPLPVFLYNMPSHTKLISGLTIALIVTRSDSTS